MAQTDPFGVIDLEEKPQAMLFDGWGFVPMPEAELVAAAKPVDPELQVEAAA